MGNGRYRRAENSHRKLLAFYLAAFQSVCSWAVLIQGSFSEDDVKNTSEVSAAAWRKHASGSNGKQET